MAKPPEFDDDEAYLLDYISNGKTDGQWFDASYLLVGVGLAVWGLAEQNRLTVAIGLGVIVLGFFQRLKANRHGTAITRRILAKYQEACKPEDDS